MVMSNDNTTSDDREQVSRITARSFDAATERLKERGVSDLELGRALLAAGLSRWSRAMPADQFVNELAQLVAGAAAAVGVALEEASSNRPTKH